MSQVTPSSRPVGKAAAPRGPPPPKARGTPPPPGSGPLARRNAVPEEAQGPKLKPLFWSTVTQVPQESVFSESTKIYFDEEALQRQFLAAAPKAAAQKKPSSRVDDRGKKYVRLLDRKSSELLAIAFSRLPPVERFKEILESLDNFPESLHGEAVTALQIASTEHQEVFAKLQQMNLQVSDLHQLDTPERYLWVLTAVESSTLKVAGGALLVGPARDLPDLASAASRVSSSCRLFRGSELMRRAIATALAVGNVLNRGTARSNARAVVLPDSLLKLEEMRASTTDSSSSSEEDRSGPTRRLPSLLDFLAQSLADDPANGSTVQEMMEEAKSLQAKALAAKAVCLEDSELSCARLIERAQSTRESLRKVPNAEVLAGRVGQVHSEATQCLEHIRTVKDELSAAQVWASSRAKVTSEEWFGGWASFFDQLRTALSRVKPKASTTSSSSPAQAQTTSKQGTPAPAERRVPIALPFSPQTLPDEEDRGTVSKVASPCRSRSQAARSNLLAPPNSASSYSFGTGLTSTPQRASPNVSTSASPSDTGLLLSRLREVRSTKCVGDEDDWKQSDVSDIESPRKRSLPTEGRNFKEDSDDELEKDPEVLERRKSGLTRRRRSQRGSASERPATPERTPSSGSRSPPRAKATFPPSSKSVPELPTTSASTSSNPKSNINSNFNVDSSPDMPSATSNKRSGSSGAAGLHAVPGRQQQQQQPQLQPTRNPAQPTLLGLPQKHSQQQQQQPQKQPLQSTTSPTKISQPTAPPTKVAQPTASPSKVSQSRAPTSGKPVVGEEASSAVATPQKAAQRPIMAATKSPPSPQEGQKMGLEKLNRQRPGISRSSTLGSGPLTGSAPTPASTASALGTGSLAAGFPAASASASASAVPTPAPAPAPTSAPNVPTPAPGPTSASASASTAAPAPVSAPASAPASGRAAAGTSGKARGGGISGSASAGSAGSLGGGASTNATPGPLMKDGPPQRAPAASKQKASAPLPSDGPHPSSSSSSSSTAKRPVSRTSYPLVPATGDGKDSSNNNSNNDSTSNSNNNDNENNNYSSGVTDNGASDNAFGLASLPSLPAQSQSQSLLGGLHMPLLTSPGGASDSSTSSAWKKPGQLGYIPRLSSGEAPEKQVGDAAVTLNADLCAEVHRRSMGRPKPLVGGESSDEEAHEWGSCRQSLTPVEEDMEAPMQTARSVAPLTPTPRARAPVLLPP